MSLLSSDPPASTNNTDKLGSSDSLLAITAPADPDPTIFYFGRKIIAYVFNYSISFNTLKCQEYTREATSIFFTEFCASR